MARPYFEPLVIAGTPFDFSHLEPFTLLVDSKKAKKTLRVHVTFSNHCFTKGYTPETHVPGEPIFDRDTERPRSFCRIRHRLSFGVPALIQGLNNPKAEVWETAKRRNWAYSIKIDDPAGPYHVFLELKRAAADRRKWQDLQLTVESAYHEDPEKGPPDLIGKMGFILLCGKVYLGEPTSTKR